MMIRRGSGRTPPFSLVGLLLILLILGFKCWTLSSQNADLQQDIEKFQAEIKISAMKQEQSENKNAALQQTVHDMDNISEKLKKKLLEEEETLKTKDQDNQKKTYEITSLKNKVTKMQEQINTLNQQLDDREMDLTKAKETNTHLATERDDALEAISEKDTLINTLKRQLEQAQDEVAAVRREQMAVAKPNLVPGAMNLPNIEKKEPYYGPGQLGYISRGAVRTRDIGLRGFQFHHEVPILPRDPPNAPRKKPRFSVADMAKEPAASQNGANLVQGNGVAGHLVAPQHIDKLNPNEADPSLLRPGGPAVVERPKNPVDNNHPIAAPIQSAIMDGQVPHNDVLAPPPHHLEGENQIKEEADNHLGGQIEQNLEDTEDKNHAQEQIDEPEAQHKEQDDTDHNNAQEQIDGPEIQENGRPGHV